MAAQQMHRDSRFIAILFLRETFVKYYLFSRN